MGKTLIDNIHLDHGWEDPFRVFWAVGQGEQQPLPSPPAGHPVGHRPPWTLRPSCLPPPPGWPWAPPVPEQPADLTWEFLGQGSPPQAQWQREPADPLLWAILCFMGHGAAFLDSTLWLPLVAALNASRCCTLGSAGVIFASDPRFYTMSGIFLLL